MDVDKKVKELIHDISNDVVVAEGLMRHCKQDIKKEDYETAKEFLQRSMDRLAMLGKRIHDFRD